MAAATTDDPQPTMDDVARRLAELRSSRPPFVVGVTGAVASGKSAFAAALAVAMAAWDDHPRVETVCTDGFLLANQVLDGRGLTLRKGFPESFDAAAMAAALAGVRLGVAEFPGYSHVTYDVEPALARRLDRPDVLIVEGLGLGAQRSRLDVLIYLDAEEADLETWFTARFLGFWEAAEGDPASFYARFRTLDRGGAAALARSVWREINLPNLRLHIAPLRALAGIVVHKGHDHGIVALTAGGEDQPFGA
jgi:type I pantothenate kinase